ncbi:tRNA modification GTPase MnmE [compost metagenome]
MRAQEALEAVTHGLEIGLSGDLLAFHLKDALLHLGSITGKIDIDRDILGTIFGKFCIGK